MQGEREPAWQMLPVLNRLIDNMSEAVLIIDREDMVVALNDAAISLLDLPGKAQGLRPITQYGDLITSWSVGGEPFAPSDLVKALAGQTIPRQLATLTTAAGVQRIVQFTATPIRDEQGQVTMAMIIASDVTREQRSEAYWRTVATAARGISTELDVNRVLETVLDQIQEALGANLMIGIWRVVDGEDKLSLTTHRGLSEESVTKLGVLPFDCPSIICEAARTREILALEDTSKVPSVHSLDRDIIQDLNLGSLILSPLLAGGRLIGVLGYGLHSVLDLFEEDIRAISVASGLFAVAIDHATLYEESERLRLEMQEIASETREINQQLAIATIREQKLADEAELHRSELEGLLESLSEGVMIVAPEGQIVLVNEVARSILPLPEKEEGATILQLKDYLHLDFRRLDGTPLPFEEWPISRALDCAQFGELEVILVRPEGWRHLVFGGTCVLDHRGKLVLAINVFRDVTELRQLEQAKDEVLHTISHDLRNPLTIVQAQAQFLLKGFEKAGITGNQPRGADAIAQSAKRMNAMIQDLVDSTRIESGQLRLDKQPVSLALFVEELMDRSRGIWAVNRIKVEIPFDVPPVSADPNRLDRILTNLLSNALKYSRPDTDVLVHAEKVDGEVMTSVTDQGTGIAPEDAPHIFERYYRPKGGRKAEGLGLGLYITKMLVEAHGGRIWVESREHSGRGNGSTFYFTLPLA